MLTNVLLGIGGFVVGLFLIRAVVEMWRKFDINVVAPVVIGGVVVILIGAILSSAIQSRQEYTNTHEEVCVDKVIVKRVVPELSDGDEVVYELDNGEFLKEKAYDTTNFKKQGEELCKRKEWKEKNK